MRTIHVGLLGCGTVGTGVARILIENRDLILSRVGAVLNLKRVADIDHVITSYSIHYTKLYDTCGKPYGAKSADHLKKQLQEFPPALLMTDISKFSHQKEHNTDADHYGTKHDNADSLSDADRRYASFEQLGTVLSAIAVITSYSIHYTKLYEMALTTSISGLIIVSILGACSRKIS